MPDQLTCSNGHSWELSAHQLVCPLCGGSPLAPQDSPGDISCASSDVPPKLPRPVFWSTEYYNPARIGALVLYCSDGRWGKGFDEFCYQHLQIPRYDRWVVAGGPAVLLQRDPSRQDFYQVVREQLDFLVRVHELKRIVLITHYGCAFYGELLKRGPDECLNAQFEDLARVAELLTQWFPGIKIERYLAMRRGSLLSFHPLP
jgi:hypothetical protein